MVNGTGMGLVGIAERVRMLGASHTLVSVPGQGTTLNVIIPVQRQTNDGTHRH
jgi:signal transduction histidine kinase